MLLFSSRRRHTRWPRDWSSDVCSSDLTATPGTGPSRPMVLTERGDTVTEHTLLAAALYEGETVIRNASPNYMVQDLCFFLVRLGVRIEGSGTTTLRVHGKSAVRTDLDYAPTEDPSAA